MGDPNADGDPRLAELLAELATLDEAPRPELTAHIVRKARWQRGFRTVFFQISNLVGGLATGAAGILGVRNEGKDAKRP